MTWRTISSPMHPSYSLEDVHAYMHVLVWHVCDYFLCHAACFVWLTVPNLYFSSILASGTLLFTRSYSSRVRKERVENHGPLELGIETEEIQINATIYHTFSDARWYNTDIHLALLSIHIHPIVLHNKLCSEVSKFNKYTK
jgi:hypothetical protein